MHTAHRTKSFKSTVVAAALLSLAACGGGGSDSKTGKLSLSVVDAPIDGAQHVYVQFSGVELHGPDGTTSVDFAQAKKLDLLALTGTNDAPLLADYEVTAGEYQWMRLKIDTANDLDTYLVDSNGLSHELTIPSGAETGLKLNQGFTVAQGGVADFTIDFDLRRSIVEDAGGFKLKPVLRIVNNLEVGSLKGTVSSDLITAHCGANETGVVYLFNGSVTADDVEGDSGDPITSGMVSSDGSASYEIGFLAAGSYTAAWTCDADNDDPLLNNDLSFFGSASVTITANQAATLNFN